MERFLFSSCFIDNTFLFQVEENIEWRYFSSNVCTTTVEDSSLPIGYYIMLYSRCFVDTYRFKQHWILFCINNLQFYIKVNIYCCMDNLFDPIYFTLKYLITFNLLHIIFSFALIFHFHRSFPQLLNMITPLYLLFLPFTGNF